MNNFLILWTDNLVNSKQSYVFKINLETPADLGRHSPASLELEKLE